MDYYFDHLIEDHYEKDFCKIYPHLDGHRITDIVCLGLGKVTNEHVIQNHPNPKSKFRNIKDAELVNESMYQLALLMKYRQFLEQEGHVIERMYFQDPDFTVADEDFLHSLGFEVHVGRLLTKPLTDSTFLFALGMEFAGIPEALEDAFPALYVGPELKDHAETVRYFLKEFPDTFELQMKHRKGEDVLEEFEGATIGWPLPVRNNTILRMGHDIRALKHTKRDSIDGQAVNVENGNEERYVTSRKLCTHPFRAILDSQTSKCTPLPILCPGSQSAIKVTPMVMRIVADSVQE